MLRFGAEAIFKGDGREPTDAEIDAIVDRTRTSADGRGALAGYQ